MILWTDSTSMLGIGDLNASTVSLAQGGTGWGNMTAGTGRRGGSIQAKKSLALSPSETLLQASPSRLLSVNLPVHHRVCSALAKSLWSE